MKMLTLSYSLLGWTALSSLLLACQKEEKKPAPAPGQTLAGYEEVRAILDRSCVQCHAGSNSPRLLTYEEVRASAQSGALMASVLRTGAHPMPPTEALSPSEIATLQTWIDAKMPSDSP